VLGPWGPKNPKVLIFKNPYRITRPSSPPLSSRPFPLRRGARSYPSLGGRTGTDRGPWATRPKKRPRGRPAPCTISSPRRGPVLMDILKHSTACSGPLYVEIDVCVIHGPGRCQIGGWTDTSPTRQERLSPHLNCFLRGSNSPAPPTSSSIPAPRRFIPWPALLAWDEGDRIAAELYIVRSSRSSGCLVSYSGPGGQLFPSLGPVPCSAGGLPPDLLPSVFFPA